MNARIINRKSEDAAGQGWYQIEVTGEHPAGAGRQQVIDLRAIDSMTKQFNRQAEEDENFAGLLVDADHLSHDLDQKTEAYGWLKELRVRHGQLEGRIEWTDLGTAAIQNKRYKFFSTEYPADALETVDEQRVRPLALAGLALTNRPNNQGGRPISNRCGDSPCSCFNKTESPKLKNDMKNIAEKLGLAPEATEEEILAAITSLQDEASAAAAAKAETEAETILNRHASKITAASREEWKQQLITNREGTERLLASLPEPTKAPAQAPIHNRVQQPTSPAGGTAAEFADKDGQRMELVEGIKNRQGVSFARAWDIARQQKPSLFN